MTATPSAFFSYARSDDEHELNRLTLLRGRLQGEIRAQAGMKIDIFQDRKLAWGDNWKKTIREAAAGAWFFIPIITPSFFKSTACAEEFEVFQEHQNKVHEKTPDVKVILPIYWIEADELSDPAWREGIPMAKTLAENQWSDWRDLRLEPIDSVNVARTLEQMAKDVRKLLKTLGVLKPPVPVAAATGTGTGLVVPARGTEVVASTTQTEELAAAAPRADRGPNPQAATRELVVDAQGKGGAFTTIAEALLFAQVDSVILVRPGTYNEGIVLNKSLTILGDGAPEDIIVEAEGADAVLFIAPFGRIANLTLRQNGGGDWYGVDMARGRLILEDCDITSKSLACVAIHGTAEATVRRNQIHNGNQSGVFVYDNGKGTIEDNDISGNALPGLLIREGGAPLVRRNRIRDGKSFGVFVHKDGKGTIEDNRIFANTNAGIWVQEQGDPTCRNNRVNKNAGAGVRVKKGGRGTFIRNDLRDNVGGAWHIDPDCLPNVKREGNIES